MKKIDDILEPGGVINLNADVENPHFEFLILVATAVQKLIDAHNELLETHTEETDHESTVYGRGKTGWRPF